MQDFIYSALLWFAFLSILTIFFAVKAYIFGTRLSIYMKNNYYEQWKVLTSYGPVGPGWSTGKGIAYLYKESDFAKEDIKLQRLKNSTRANTSYFILMMATIMASIILFIIAAGYIFN